MQSNSKANQAGDKAKEKLRPSGGNTAATSGIVQVGGRHAGREVSLSKWFTFSAAG
jgi:hypothetical protein